MSSPSICFGDSNSGLQVGVGNGPITANFNISPNIQSRLPIVYEAVFDSSEQRHEVECLPGTRADVLRQIINWASSPHAPCILWLNGMAGTGKSTIARTIASTFSRNKMLGASFFFKRGEGDRGNATKLFPTIAGHLADKLPQLRPIIDQAIQDEPGIAFKSIEKQFKKLLLQPLLSLGSSDRPQTIVIVIDALDECEDEGDIKKIIELIPRLRPTCLQVFLTSRPELPKTKEFTILEHEELRLHDVTTEEIEHDISLFLNHRLAEIREEHEPPLPIDWPGTIDFRKLVSLSTPLFIFASTVCRIFEDPDWDPVDSLTEILTHQYSESKLDGTYLPVLDRIFNRQSGSQQKKLIQEFQQVVGATVLLESPLSVSSLSKLIGLGQRLVYLRLLPLRSILNISPDAPIRLFHLSFRDFLIGYETREKTPLWVDRKKAHHFLAGRCILTCRSLRKNICRLPSDGTPRADIDQQTIDRYLSPELQYACRYWASHLIQAESHALLDDVLLFLQSHFLHWLEAMSLLGLILEVVGTIDSLQVAIPRSYPSRMLDFLHDAKRFVLKNCQIADEAPLQLYCTGLIFAPKTSLVRKSFIKLQALEGHSGLISSVAFSPDSRLLASGSYDNTVRIWNTTTGACQQTLKGHSNFVQSVKFSHDGLLLASGSYDYTVRLWNPVTGVLQCTLEGNLGWVHSVAFSPDSRLLASSSEDDTVRLWNTASGVLQQSLEGHSEFVLSAEFSPTAQVLASGSHDRTVCLWDLVTGQIRHTLQGHTGGVNSVAFSSDGKLLASGSDYHTVRLWYTASGVLLHILEGHTKRVRSLAFSPNGYLLVSGSNDKTVRLWNSETGELQQTLEGNLGRVCSVAFSPDSQLLASGSDDCAVRLWGMASGGAIYSSLERHSDEVHSVVFSPDGRLLASDSYDRTLYLWDTATGVLKQTWELEATFNFVKFSHDNSYLHTDIGTLHIQSSGDTTTSRPTHVGLEISSHQKQWIKLNGENLLYLPSDDRPTCFDISGGTLALGHESGRVSFIGFSF